MKILLFKLKNSGMRKIVLFLLWFFCALGVYAQQKEIRGIVRNSTTNEPLVGVTVQTKSKTVITDANGRFVTTGNVGETLLLRYVGMADVSYKITDASADIQLTMQASVNDLNAVVVTGYKSERRADLTAAVSVVDLKAVKTIPATSPMIALQGQVPGLYVAIDGSPTGGNGGPPQILIRGVNSLGSSAPLYVIDGVPTNRYEVFAALSGNSIASIQVLKDASASSIYGSRASNGVIIVTTKDGRGGSEAEKINMQFTSSLTWQTEKPWFESVLSSEGRGRALWQAAINDKLDPNALSTNKIYSYDWNNDFNNPVLNKVNIAPYVGGDSLQPVGNTNWQKALYKTAHFYNNDLSISAGTAKSGFLVDLSYVKNDGLIVFTNYRRYAARINARTSVFNDRLRIGENLLISNSSQVNSTTDIGGASTPGLSLTLAPTIPLYKTNGTYGGPEGPGYSDRNNPVDMQYLNRYNTNNQTLGYGNVFVEIEPVKNLVLRSSLGFDYSDQLFRTIHFVGNEGPRYSVNSLALQQGKELALTWTNTASYNLQLGQHRVNFLAGTEAIKDDYQTFGAYRENFAVSDLSYLQFNAASGPTTANGSATGYRLLSQFGKVFYAFEDKYLASVTVRRDGSSRFGTNNQYGIFPAATVGWRINNENFMKGQTLISNLKLRAGIGRVGNQNIGNVGHYGLIQANYGSSNGPWLNTGTAYDIYGVNTGTLPSGFVYVQGENQNLKWEQTAEVNVGLDFGFFNEKLIGSFDYFSRNTTNILIQPPLASAVGEGQLRFVNGASKSNKGWELSLGYRNTTSKGLTYSISGNAGHFHDEITFLPEDVRAAYPGNVQQTILGHSQFSFFGYKTDGIFQSQAEVDKHAKQPGAGVGRLNFKDLNHDGVIDANDQTWLGTALPALDYGVRFAIDYKGFTFSVFGSGVAGKKSFDPAKFFNYFVDTRNNYGPGVFSAWTPKNNTSNIPALSILNPNGEDRSSDFYIVNASYFKLRNVQLGYSLPQPIAKSLRAQALSVYVSGQNLFALKSKQFTSKDPERTSFDVWPVPTSVTVGVNLNF